MTGFTKQTQAEMLNDRVEPTLYLALLTGTDAGDEPNEDGTLPAGMDEVFSGVAQFGYDRAAVTGDATPGDGDWSAASQGPPSTVQLPKTGGSAISFEASGGNFGDLTAWALMRSPISGTWDPDDVEASGPITDGSGTPIKVTINDGSAFEFNETNPVVLRLGDPAKVADASAGEERTVPT